MSEDSEVMQVPPPKRRRMEETTGETSASGANCNARSALHVDPPDASKYNSWNHEEVLQFFKLRKVDTSELKRTLEELLLEMIEGSEGAQVEGKHLDRIALLTREEEHILVMTSRAKDTARMERTIASIICHAQSLQQQHYVTFNDPIHGSIKLHPLLVEIIDTPEFQRLRHIKQLGPTCYVYPGATHTRFAHSIGVCYIAGELGQSLKKRQPELAITDIDILCIQIAGLCHDLGHGPFSHLFEDVAEEILQEHQHTGDTPVWKHEVISRKIFDTIYQRKKGRFQHYGLDDVDIQFICEQLEARETDNGHDLKGRPKKKFLYEIVANKRNGIDVDKWDYFARDCYYLGISSDFNWRRCMSVALIAAPEDDPDDLQICLRDKEVGTIYSMFHTRSILHRLAYKHKTTRVVHHMLKKSLLFAKDSLLLRGPCDGPLQEQPRSWSLKTAILAAGQKEKADISGFLLLTDEITSHILNAPCDDEFGSLSKAQELLRKIEMRQLYHLVAAAKVPAENIDIVSKTSPQLAELAPDEGLFVDVVKFSFGSEKKHVLAAATNPDDGNPLKDLRFCTKQAPWKAVLVNPKQVSQLVTPRGFSETLVRLYCRDDDRKAHLEAFERWVERNLGEGAEVLAPYASEEKRQRPSALIPPSEPESKRKLF